MGWHPWWTEAEANAEMARVLFRRRLYSGVLFHALMAIGTGAKAFIARGTTLNDLGSLTIGQMGQHMIGDFARREPPKTHPYSRLLALIPVRGPELIACDVRLAGLAQAIGVPDLYLASRYPDTTSWPAGVQAPSQAIKRRHAQQALEAMDDLLQEGRSRSAIGRS